MNKKAKTGIIHFLILFIGVVLGYQWSQFEYKDKCLDLGGGFEPGGYPICVIEKWDKEKKGDNDMMMPVESNNGIGDGAEDLGELLKREKRKIKMSVKIPTWKFDEGKKDFVVEFTTYEVPKSKTILKATLKKLFEVKGGEKWNGLVFDSVNLKNGKATINLGGEWYPVGDMSGAAMKNELEAAVFQFKNIKSLEVRLNGKIFDWCMDDLSGGESGCPNKKQLWIVEK